MRNILSGGILGALGVLAYNHYRAEIAPPPDPRALEVEATSRYHCDGRVYCSQMTSCEEATWFLRNCPGVKMDGEGDGVPCEKQWCGIR